MRSVAALLAISAVTFVNADIDIQMKIEKDVATEWGEQKMEEWEQIVGEWEALVDKAQQEIWDIKEDVRDLVEREISLSQQIAEEALSYLGTALTIDGTPLSWMEEPETMMTKINQDQVLVTQPFDHDLIENLVSSVVSERYADGSDVIVLIRDDYMKKGEIVRDISMRANQARSPLSMFWTMLECEDSGMNTKCTYESSDNEDNEQSFEDTLEASLMDNVDDIEDLIENIVENIVEEVVEDLEEIIEEVAEDIFEDVEDLAREAKAWAQNVVKGINDIKSKQTAKPQTMMNTATTVNSRSNTGYYALGAGAVMMIAAAGVALYQNKRKEQKCYTERLLASYAEQDLA